MRKDRIFMFALAGAGKDTVADMLFEHHNIHGLALADPIREEYVRRLGRDDHRQNRPMMIRIGESYKEIYGKDVWCRAAEQFIQEHEWATIVPTSGYVIKDGRYQHEYDYFVKERGWTPLRLVAKDEIRLERLKRRDGDIHMDALKFERENFIADVGEHVFTIHNDGTMTQLRQQLREFVSTLGG